MGVPPPLPSLYGGQVGASTCSEGIGSMFAEYVLLASHNPYPIIVSFVANNI